MDSTNKATAVRQVTPEIPKREDAALMGLRVSGLRGLDDFEAGPFAQFNFLVGRCGSGKTSVLHAIRLLEANRPEAPLVTGELATSQAREEHNRNDEIAKRLFPGGNDRRPISIHGDYELGTCTRVDIRRMNGTPREVVFKWVIGAFNAPPRTLSSPPPTEPDRGRIRELCPHEEINAEAYSSATPLVRSHMRSQLAIAPERRRTDLASAHAMAHLADAAARGLPIFLAHDLDLACRWYGPGYWKTLHAFVRAVGGQLFAGVASHEFVNDLEPQPAASSSSTTTLHKQVSQTPWTAATAT